MKDADWKEEDVGQTVTQALEDTTIIFLFYPFIVLEAAGNRGSLRWDLKVLWWTQNHSVKQVLLKHNFIHSTNTCLGFISW